MNTVLRYLELSQPILLNCGMKIAITVERVDGEPIEYMALDKYVDCLHC